MWILLWRFLYITSTYVKLFMLLEFPIKFVKKVHKIEIFWFVLHFGVCIEHTTDYLLIGCGDSDSTTGDSAVNASENAGPGAFNTEPKDLVFIVDGSGSVRPDNFQLILSFVENIVKNINMDNVAVGLIVFSSEVKIIFEPSQNTTKDKLLEDIRSTSYPEEMTNTAEALRTLRLNVFGTNDHRPGVENVAIVITDGVSTDRMQTFSEADLVHKANITVYALGIGLADTTELDRIASMPTETYRHIMQDFSMLEELGTQLFSTECTYGMYWCCDFTPLFIFTKLFL